MDWKHWFDLVVQSIGKSVLLWAVGVFAANSVSAAENAAAPVHFVNGSFVHEWLVLGPIPSRDLETDFLSSAGGEANVRPKAGDVVSLADGKRLSWTRLQSLQDVVNLERAFGIQDGVVSYAYCELQSEQAGESHIRAVANDASLLRFNGEVVGSLPVSKGTGDPLPFVPVQLRAGRNACLIKLKGGRFECVFVFQPLPTTRSLVEFQVADLARRNVPGALVQIYSGGEVMAAARTDPSGRAAVCLYPLAESYDLRVTAGEMGRWMFDVKFQPRERRQLEVKLTNAVSISGEVLALDGSPQNAILVQAVRVSGGEPLMPSDAPIKSLLPLPRFSESVLSDTNGQFRFVNLRPGSYQLRGHAADGFVFPANRAGTNVTAPLIIDVEPGRTRPGVQFRFPEVKKGVWKSYPINLGLRETHPISLERTPDGRLWIGTGEASLQTFDGLEFKTVASSPEVPANEIRDVKHAADGAIWIGTLGGMARHIEHRTESFSFTETLKRKAVHDILPDADGTVWFATGSGLGRFDGREWAMFTTHEGLPANAVVALWRSRDGLMWLATSQGLVRFDGQNFTLVQPICALFEGEGKRLYQARDGAVWFATLRGAYRYDGQTFTRLGAEEGLLSDQIHDIAETSDGALWFASSKGLTKFNGTTFVHYTQADGLSNEWVRRILVDDDDVLWCANGWGVSRFDPKGFRGFTNRDGLSVGSGETAGVLTMEPDPHQGAWIGTAWGGVYRVDGDKLSLHTERFYVRRIHRAADGTLWLGGEPFGIARFDGNQVVPVLQREWVTALCSDQQGNLWFGQGWYNEGLSRYNPTTGESTVFTTAHGLPNGAVWSVVQSADGAIWVGTEDGLARIRDSKIEDFRRKLGRLTGAVFHLRRDEEDSVWIGGRLGLHILKSVPLESGDKLLPTEAGATTTLLGEGLQRVSITSTNGLPDQHIWSSARSADGITWMGTDHTGLLGYDGKAVTAIDKRDGLLGSHVMGVVAEADGALLVGFYESGISRYRPAKTPPSVRLVSLQLNDQVVTNFANLPRILTGNRVTFQYREIDLKTHPEKRQFWYHVTGPSGATLFAAVTRDRRFDWTPRKGGAYTFEVQAIDRDLNYSAPAKLNLQVTVPWYSNAWILAPAGSAFGGLLVWAFVARALYVRKSREAVLLRERVRIARDLHDHLGAGLTDLALAGDLMRQQFDQAGAAQILAARLSSSARELTRTMGEAIWMIDPEKDTLRSFPSFISSYAERFFAGSSLRLRFEFPTEIPDLLFPAEFRRSLLMVVKESLNNVAKHAQATEVRIKLEIDERNFCISIADNGVGFVKNQVKTDCRGLINMQQRLHELGGQLEIESADGQGTRVRARVRLPRRW